MAAGIADVDLFAHGAGFEVDGFGNWVCWIVVGYEYFGFGEEREKKLRRLIVFRKAKFFHKPKNIWALSVTKTCEPGDIPTTEFCTEEYWRYGSENINDIVKLGPARVCSNVVWPLALFPDSLC